MMSPLRILFFAGTAVVMVACATDNATSPAASSEAAAALISAPLGFDQIQTSFVGSSSATSGFVPFLAQNGQDSPDDQDGDRDAQHENHGPGWGGLMGGGLGDGFVGGIRFGQGFGRGPFGEWDDADACAFSTTTNRLECTTVRRNGLTVSRSFSFLDASGAVQQAYDTGTTNTVNVKTAVTGTRVHHDDDTSTVNSSSDFTVTGLATGSTQRTVNGASAGTESTKGIRRDSTPFTASRTAGDTTTGLVIPIQNGRPTYPTAGTVIRSMQAIVTLTGQTPSTSSRREVVTYDGSATAKVVITHDGVTRNCTKPLPHGRLTCQ
jgi:hypothetical protein